MNLKIVLCLAALSLAGCTSEPISTDWVSGQTQTTYDRFQKLSWTVGPFIPYDDGKGYTGHLYLCRASGGSVGSEYLLGVENTSPNPELFTGAASMTGATLPVQQMGEALPPQQIDSRANSAQFRENVRVVLPKDLLIGCGSSGLTVRLYGGRRDLDVTIPSSYIQGFLRKT
jgi:hypothetical protein